MNILYKLFYKPTGRKAQSTTGKTFGLRDFVGFSGFKFGKKTFANYINNGFVDNLDVNSVVSYIAEGKGSIPWVLKERKGEEITINTTSALNAVLKNPNLNQSWSEFIESTSVMYNTTGNIYILGVEAVGFTGFSEISILPSQVTAPVIKGFNEPVEGYEVCVQKTIKYPSEEILHVKRFDPRLEAFSSMIGLSPLESALLAYASSTEKWQAMASILKNRGAMGIVTTKGGRGMTPENAKEMKSLYRKEYGGGSEFGTPMFTGADLDFIKMGMSAEDLKLMDQGVISLRAICNIFKVDSSLFNDPENKKFNNVKEADKRFYTKAVIPFLNKLKEGLNDWLVAPYALAEGKELFLDYDTSGVESLQDDINEKAKTIDILIKAGVISPNEGREMISLGRIEGDINLDTYYVQMPKAQETDPNLD